MATQSENRVSREQVQTALSRVMLQKLRADTYPSFTQMDLLERSIPPSLHGEYVSILLEKVADDRWPSISLLRRIERFAERV
jgi:hypothetical protein